MSSNVRKEISVAIIRSHAGEIYKLSWSNLHICFNSFIAHTFHNCSEHAGSLHLDENHCMHVTASLFGNRAGQNRYRTNLKWMPKEVASNLSSFCRSQSKNARNCGDNFSCRMLVYVHWLMVLHAIEAVNSFGWIWTKMQTQFFYQMTSQQKFRLV